MKAVPTRTVTNKYVRNNSMGSQLTQKSPDGIPAPAKPNPQKPIRAKPAKTDPGTAQRITANHP
jgi:hypothetical protein